MLRLGRQFITCVLTYYEFKSFCEFPPPVLYKYPAPLPLKTLANWGGFRPCSATRFDLFAFADDVDVVCVINPRSHSA